MENDKLVRLSDVKTELMLTAERYTVAHEAHGMGTVVWSDNLISVSNALDTVRSIPAVDYVPMDFHDRCMQTEIRKRHDLERFVKWVMDEIFSENWEDNRIAFDELACRKLVKMGYVAVDEENDLYYRKDEPEDG